MGITASASKVYRSRKPIVEDVVNKFLNCSDLKHGFARIKCPDCGKLYLLALPPSPRDSPGPGTAAAQMLTWHHSGFHVHNGHRIAQYIIRKPFSEKRNFLQRLLRHGHLPFQEQPRDQA